MKPYTTTAIIIGAIIYLWWGIVSIKDIIEYVKVSKKDHDNVPYFFRIINQSTAYFLGFNVGVLLYILIIGVINESLIN